MAFNRVSRMLDRVRRRSERGAAAVEFAIGGGLLAMMAFGTAEYGLTLQKSHTLASAVRQAARVASTPCVASTDCKTGNRPYDDYYILRAAEAGMGDYWPEVKRVVIYKIVGNSTTKGDGGAPAQCMSSSTGLSLSSATPVPVYCNVYTKNTTFTKLDGTTGVNLLRNLSAFEASNGQDNVDQLKLSFGSGTNCATGLSRYFCPVSPPGNSSLRPRTLRNPSRVGVYIDIDHKFITGLFGNGRSIQQWSAFSLEPHPDDNSTDIAGSGGTVTPTPGQYDLQIVKTDGVSEVQPGDNLSYTITVTNAGSQRVNNATVEDYVPTGFGSISWTCTASTGSSCAASGTTGTLGAVTIASGGNVVYTFNATLSPAFSDAFIENSAQAIMPPGISDETPANNISRDRNSVARPDLQITKDDGQTAVAPGALVTYTINARNLGPGTAVNAFVSDTVPALLSSVTWTCTSGGGASCPAASGSANLSQTVTLPLNGELIYTVRGTLSATATGTLDNTATLTPAPGKIDPNLSNNSDTDSDLILKPDLRMTKTLVGVARAGGTATYSVVAENIGLVNIVGAKVTDTPPAILTGVTFTCAGTGTTCTGGSGAIDATINLPVGARATYTLVGTLPLSASGSLVNTATVTVPLPFTDETPSNNTMTITNAITQMNLGITKAVSPAGNIGPGNTLTYTVIASNLSGGSVNDVVVSDIIDTAILGPVTWTCATNAGGAVCDQTSGSDNIAATADFPAAGSVRYTVTATVKATAAIGSTLINTATVKMPGAPSVGAYESSAGDNTATVTNSLVHPSLTVVKSVNDNTVSKGQAITYTVTVRNDGPTDVTAATVSDTMPTQLTGVTWTCSVPAADGSCSTPTGSGNINNAVTLKVGKTATYSINATISASAAVGVFRNTATATGPAGPPSCSGTITACDWEDVDIQNPDLEVVSKGVSPSSGVGIGSVLTYTLITRNNGPSSVTGAVIADNVTSMLGSVSWTCAGSASPLATCGALSGTGNTISVSANMASGSTVTLTITGTVLPTASGSITNTGTITPPSGVTDRNTANNTKTSSNVTVNKPDIAVTKTNGLGNVGRGQVVTYTVVAQNSGAGVVTDVVVADAMPPASLMTGVTWTCTSLGGATCPAGSGSGAFSHTVTLGAGWKLTYNITGTVSSTATLGALTNTASATVPVGVIETSTTNNSASKTNQIVGPDMSVTKTDGTTSMSPGQSTTYTIVAKNNGPVSVTGATVVDTMPATLTGVTWTCSPSSGSTCPASSGSGNISHTVNLPVSGQLTYSVTGTLSSTATGTLVNTATVNNPSGLTDPTIANNTATDTNTIAQPDLVITKTDGVTTVNPGQVVTWTIVASNAGPGPIVGARVVDNPDGRLSSVSWTCSAGSGATCPAASGTGALNHTFNLNASASTTFTFRGTLSTTATGTLANTATISTPTGITDPDPTDNSATDTDNINGPDLSITKTDGLTSVDVGQLVTYTIIASNLGPAPVTGAIIADTIPNKLSGVTWTCAATGTVSCPTASGSGNIAATTGAMASGATLKYTVQGTVILTASGSLANTATITAPAGTPDPSTGNNSATDTDTIVTPDLEITKSSSAASYMAGTSITYTIFARNNGPAALTGVTITDNVPILLTGVTWTCNASGGATCTASGTGSINQSVNLPVSATLTYTLVGTIPAITPAGSISNTATITQPSGVIDRNTSNNTKTETDTITAAVTTTAKPPDDGT